MVKWSPVFFFPQGIFHFQLGRGDPMLHTRLRPHCKEFLEKIAKLYELHVFTFGSRPYAHTIAGIALILNFLRGHFLLKSDVSCINFVMVAYKRHNT